MTAQSLTSLNLESLGIHLNSVAHPDRLAILSTATPNQFDILDTQTQQRLGSVKQSAQSTHTVELFWGKGGFMGMITAPQGLRYFALPGSRIQVQGTQLTLEGAPITSNSSKQASQRSGKPQPQGHATQATILGAGLATRFERISGDSTQYSKPAVPLAGNKSVIECIANSLAVHGFSHLIVNTYFKPTSLKAGLAKSQAERVSYIDEAEPSGTAGGLRKMLTVPAHQALLNRNQPLLVVQGDSVTDADFSALMNAHVANQALVTIGCQEVAQKDVDKFGIIVTDCSGVDGQSGRIVGFQEKPKAEEAKSRLGNTGFYIFSPQAYPLVEQIYAAHLKQAQSAAQAAGQPIPEEAPLDFATDLFPAILQYSQEHPEHGVFWAQAVEGYWSDIGNPVQYLETLHDLYAGKVQIPLPTDRDAYYRDGVIFWEGAAALADAEGAQLSGNVVVARAFAAPAEQVVS